MDASRWWQIIRMAGSEFLKDKAPRLGAALAYYAIFSMAPLFVIVIGVVGLIEGQRAHTQSYLIDQINMLIGAEGGQAVRAMLESASSGGSGIVGSVLGIFMLIFGATGLFVELQDALNTIWDVKPREDAGVWGMVRTRFLSFAMIMGVAFLLLVSLIVSAALTAIGALFGDWATSAIGQAINVVVSMLIISLLFAMIFRFLPDARVPWQDVWVGAIATAVLFTLGKYAIGLYLGSSGLASAYGAAGSLAVLLVWLYYSSQIFLFGAELTQAYSTIRGSKTVPTPDAERGHETPPKPSSPRGGLPAGAGS